MGVGVERNRGGRRGEGGEEEAGRKVCGGAGGGGVNGMVGVGEKRGGGVWRCSGGLKGRKGEGRGGGGEGGSVEGDGWGCYGVKRGDAGRGEKADERTEGKKGGGAKGEARKPDPCWGSDGLREERGTIS